VNRIIDGGVDTFAAIMGLMELATISNGFNYQSLLCYFAVNVIFLFWAGVRGAFFLLGKQDPHMLQLTGWQATVYIVALAADVAIYTVLTILTLALIRELRSIVGNTAQIIRFFADGTLTGVTEHDTRAGADAAAHPADDDEVRRAAQEVDTKSGPQLFTGHSYKLVD